MVAADVDFVAAGGGTGGAGSGGAGSGGAVAAFVVPVLLLVLSSGRVKKERNAGVRT